MRTLSPDSQEIRTRPNIMDNAPTGRNRSSKFSVAIVTSIHKDFDSRIWKQAKSLVAMGHTVDLICPWKVEDAGSLEGIRFHTFNRVEKRSLRPFLIPGRVFRRLWPVLRRVDIVHFHDIDILPWMTLISLVKPVIYDVHENYPVDMLVKHYIPDLLRKPLYHLVRFSQLALSLIIRNIVLVVPSQKADFPHPRLRLQMVRNYASNTLLEEVADDYMKREDLVIFTGAHSIHNGSLLLLEIAERTKRQHPHLVYHVFDRFADYREIKSLFIAEVQRRNLEENVKILPPVLPHEMMSVLNRATIGIAPNLRVPQHIVGLPTKLFEYMAAGLPIVASDLPPAIEFVGSSKAGVLAQPENPASFADSIAKLINDRSYARSLGQNGQRAFREKYSWESQMPDLAKFYERILCPVRERQ